MNIIDVFIIGAVLAGALHGYRQGLITGLANLAGNIIGLVVASAEYGHVYNWVQQYFHLQQKLEEPIFTLIRPSVEARAAGLEQQALGQILGNLPPEVQRLLPGDPQGIRVLPAGVLDSIAHRIAGVVADNILHIMSFALIFLTVVAIVQVAALVLLKPLGIFGATFNRKGGLIFGGLGALTGMIVLAGLLFPLAKLGGQGTIAVLINHSYFFPMLVQLFNVLAQHMGVQLGQWLTEPDLRSLLNMDLTKITGMKN